MSFVIMFFAGAFLCNCIPHVASGLLGQPFPTPFSKPRGVGDSTPMVNFLWGFFNLLAGICLLSRHPATMQFDWGFVALIVGAFAMGLNLSHHFGKVRRSRAS